ncbi:hypothetical protein [Bartonella sp. AU18XJBT]|uniref:hypothetical protein n=1 Tax=Bartonella sp. AU18XJBT TaxID=3019089 RepID=UPI002362FA47|nr:hypothetical protein [Bartonella sp. AU18XJBT]
MVRVTGGSVFVKGGKSWDVKSVKIEGEMKSAVRVLAGEESVGIAVNRLQG